MSGLINYVKKVFKSYPDTSTPVSAANLNYLDNAIYNLDQAVGAEFDNISGRLGVFYNTLADAEADTANIPNGTMVYTDEASNDNTTAANVSYDDGTQQGSNVQTQIAGINANLAASDGLVFNFAYSNGQHGYIDENGDFKSFSSGAVYLGQYSTNTQLDVSELGATNVNQFILVPTETSYSRSQGQGSGVYTLTYVLHDGSLTLSNGMLTITLATGSSNYGDCTVNCDLYYVGGRPSTPYGFNGNLDLLVEWDAWTANARAGLTVLADDGTTVYSSTNAGAGNYGAFTWNFQGNVIARKKGTYVYMGLGASGVYGPSRISVDVGEVICVHSRSSAGGTPNGILVYRVPD